MWMVYTSFYRSIINNISINLVSQSCLTKKSTFHILYQQSLPLIRLDIHALPLLNKLSWSGLSLRPPREVVCQLVLLLNVYMFTWFSLMAVYNNQRSDYPGQDRLPNWLSGALQPLATRTVGRDADSVASSHSAPIRVQYCLYSESGLFWAI